MTFGRNILNTLEQTLYASVFPWACYVINFSCFKPDTENNANVENYASRTSGTHMEFFRTSRYR